MPWNILEIIDSENVTEREVKKAYAKKLKVTRPDRDPEGFQKLRDAYEQALEILRYRSYDDEEENAYHFFGGGGFRPKLSSTSSVTSIDDYSPNLNQSKDQPEISLIIDSILLDLKTSNVGSAQANLEKSGQYIYLHPGAVDEWSQKLEATLTASQIVQLDFSDDLLIYELQSENSGVINACIDAWHSELAFERLTQLASSINSKPDSFIGDRAGYVCEKLSCIIAIYSVDEAAALSSVSMKLMAEQVFYDEFESEKMVHLGWVFRELPDKDRVFWHRAVNAQVSDEEWNAPDINETFKTLNRKAHITHETLPLVRQFVPDQHVINVRVVFKDESIPTTISKNSSRGDTYSSYETGGSGRKHRSSYSSESESSVPSWVFVVGVLMLFKLVMFLSRDDYQQENPDLKIDMENVIRVDDARLISAEELLEKYRKKQNERLDNTKEDSSKSLPFGVDSYPKLPELEEPLIPYNGEFKLPE